MDEHPGDTLGKRFLTFCGSILAILAFGAILYFGVRAFGPGDGEVADGGAGEFRTEKRRLVEKEQDAELGKFAKDEAKGTVQMPVDHLFSYAVAILKKQQESKSKVGVPGAAPVVPEGGTPAHDPNLSKFEG
ncbi:MAG: hypothetical protein KA004_10650 [Verrucomicrobiales bacterium]|nr:hypothetical protein [Verrucomicrobiales bacterium]